MTDHAAGHDVQRPLGSLVQRWIRPWSERPNVNILEYLHERWTARTLSTRFVIASTIVICTTMLLIGAWVDARIRKTVIDNAAVTSARYMEALFQEPLQELATQRSLSPNTRLKIAGLVEDNQLGRPILESKIWLTDGTIVFRSEGSGTGTKPPMTPELLGAVNGQIMADFEDVSDIESLEERRYGKPIFEIYAPIRELGTGRIIAVAELYEDATDMIRDFTIARQQSWLVVGSLSFGMLSLLFGIVHRGSLLILKQQCDLTNTIARQSKLLKQNEDLRSRVTRAHLKSAALTDKLLCRIGADLHDGPAQLLSLALLRLHEVEHDTQISPVPAGEHRSPSDAVEQVRKVMQEALAEIRHLSAGVSLPDIENLTPTEVVLLAVHAHERHSKTKVDAQIGALPECLPLSVRTCMFRCVQQSLSNAFRHAGGKGQKVSAGMKGNTISLLISDAGPGFELASLNRRSDTLGVPGLRHRVESLGGTFEIRSTIGTGTTVHVELPQGSLA